MRADIPRRPPLGRRTSASAHSPKRTPAVRPVRSLGLSGPPPLRYDPPRSVAWLPRSARLSERMRSGAGYIATYPRSGERSASGGLGEPAASDGVEVLDLIWVAALLAIDFTIPTGGTIAPAGDGHRERFTRSQGRSVTRVSPSFRRRRACKRRLCRCSETNLLQSWKVQIGGRFAERRPTRT